MKSDAEVMALCDTIRVTSFAIHNYLRHGHLEKVYVNALINFGAPKLEIRKYVL